MYQAKKAGEKFCGTHIKGTPHGEITAGEQVVDTTVKIEVWAQDIKGIIYYIDNNSNVYKMEDVLEGKENPDGESTDDEELYESGTRITLVNDEETLTDLVSGSVGEGLAVKFMAHRKVASEMPNPTDILAGKVKELKATEISAMYSLTVSLCYELKEAHDKKSSKFDDMVNNFLRFAMDNFETELVVMGIKLALTQYALPIDPDEVACFDEFHERFGKYITAAQSA